MLYWVVLDPRACWWRLSDSVCEKECMGLWGSNGGELEGREGRDDGWN